METISALDENSNKPFLRNDFLIDARELSDSVRGNFQACNAHFLLKNLKKVFFNKVTRFSCKTEK